jgi:hypothetical protein
MLLPMNELLLFLALSATPSQPPACCHPATSVLDHVDEDKERAELVGYFLSTGTLTATYYGSALYFGASRKQAVWISVAGSLATILVKELYDHSKAGRFGLEEAGVGIVGSAAGLWLADRKLWPEAQRGR